MTKSIYKRKGDFKGFLFIFGLSVIILILAYTQHQVNLLQDKSREYLRFRVRVFEENINNPSSDIDLNFFFTEVIQGTDYPIIYTDTDMEPRIWLNISAELDTLRTLDHKAAAELKEYLRDMDEENTPIPITYQGEVLGYYHYGISPVIQRLRWLPYIEIAAAVLFILIAYLGFAQIKRSEQRHIWVGMAKETAHQLGTPISSLGGWIELLRESPDQLDAARREMEIDVHRLGKIAARFSQIGSVPSLKPAKLQPIISSAAAYFRKRVPQFGKKITITEEYQTDPVLNLNGELFEWVVENLIRNAIDAIDLNDGEIVICVTGNDSRDYVYIDISDSGKGMNPKDRKNIFKPGFSTKKRGWGLGLSLAKRIIEDYHQGKLFVRETRPGEGTILRIMLRTEKITGTGA